MKVRYIKDWSNGNNSGNNNNWNEIEARDYSDENIALNKTVTASNPSNNGVSTSIVTDGSDDSSYAFSGKGWVQVDLGDVYDIEKIRIRRYFKNSTTEYNDTKTEISVDGSTWIAIFDCSIDGKYYETKEGKIHTLPPSPIDIDSSLSEVSKQVEVIKDNLVICVNNLKNNLISKGVSISNEKLPKMISKVLDIETSIFPIWYQDRMRYKMIDNTNRIDASYGGCGIGDKNVGYVLHGFVNGNTISTKFFMFDKKTGTFTQKRDIPYGLEFSSLSIVDGKVYAIGGENNGMEDINYMYDTSNDTWTQKTSMSSPKSYHTTNAINNKIYIIGGNPSYNYRKTEYYNVLTDTYTSVANFLSDGLRRHVSALINNKIYVLSGESTYGYGSNDVFMYNITTNTWSSVGNLSYGTMDAQCGCYKNEIFVISGIDSSVLPYVQCYNTVTNTCTIKHSTLSENYRKRQAINFCIDNIVYIANGSSSSSSSTYSNTYCFIM